MDDLSTCYGFTHLRFHQGWRWNSSDFRFQWRTTKIEHYSSCGFTASDPNMDNSVHAKSKKQQETTMNILIRIKIYVQTKIQKCNWSGKKEHNFPIQDPSSLRQTNSRLQIYALTTYMYITLYILYIYMRLVLLAVFWFWLVLTQTLVVCRLSMDFIFHPRPLQETP